LRWNNSYQGGWFWKSGEDNKIFSVSQLIDKYDQSVGRNTNMLLGVVVDKRGLVPDADVKRLAEFGNALKEQFSNKLGQTQGKGVEFVIDFGTSKKVNRAVISEDIKAGERVRKYLLEGYRAGEWEKIETGESIGHKRIGNFSAGNFSKVRLLVTKSVQKPMIKTFACYYSKKIIGK
jgi:alpha-L-fucosidase